MGLMETKNNSSSHQFTVYVLPQIDFGTILPKYFGFLGFLKFYYYE